MQYPSGRLPFFSLQVFRLLALAGCFLLLTFLYRFVFLLVYGGGTGWQSAVYDLPCGLFMSLRLDVQVSLYFLSPLLLFALLSGLSGWRIFAPAGRIWSAAAWILYASLLVVDFFYYSYFSSHFSISVFGVVDDDTRAVLQSVWDDYPVAGIALFCVLFFLTLVWLTGRIYRSRALEKLSRQRPAAYAAILIFPVAAGLMRGSTGTFPLRNHDAMVSKNSFVNMVCVNPVLCLKDAYASYTPGSRLWDAGEMLREAGYASAAEAVADYLGLPADSIQGDPLDYLLCTTKTDTFLQHNPPHVVFLQMESMGTNGLSLQSESLDVLGRLKDELEHCAYFGNFLPYTSESTVGSMEGILFANPSSYITQSVMEDKPLLSSVAIPFKKAGYETRFVSGAKQGWRNIHTFMPVQGFDFVEGQEAILHDIPGAETQDWGVFDGYMFQQILRDLQQAAAPQLVYGLSITNHSPHRLPRGYTCTGIQVGEELKQRLLNSEQYTYNGLTAFRYANDCLGDFIRAIRRGPLADKVIIAVTGDHPFKGFLKAVDDKPYDKYGVPLILYVPERYKKDRTFDPKRRGSHRDIFPTLFHLSLSGASYYNLGSDMLGSDSAGRTAFSPSHALIGDRCAIDLQTNSCYDNQDDRTFVLRDTFGEEARQLTHRYHAWFTVSRYVLLRSFRPAGSPDYATH